MFLAAIRQHAQAAKPDKKLFIAIFGDDMFRHCDILGLGVDQGQCMFGPHVRWCTVVDPDSKFSLDPDEQKKTTRILCLSVAADGLSILVTFLGSFWEQRHAGSEYSTPWPSCHSYLR